MKADEILNIKKVDNEQATQDWGTIVNKFSESFSIKNTLDNTYISRELNARNSYLEYIGYHKILERADKIITKNVETETGTSSATESRVIPQAKLVVNFQKKIVNLAVAFLFGEPVKISEDSEDTDKAFTIIRSIYKANKIDFKNRKIARILFSECECAEIWYAKETRPENVFGKLKQFFTGKTYEIGCTVVANSLGDTLYPHFDDYGKMDAFSRKYSIVESKGTINYFDIYTENLILTLKQDQSDWIPVSSTQNLFKKIPVVYYAQDTAEWKDVQSLIDRAEMLLSVNADTNDYFGSPAVVIEGELKNMPDKAEVGKLFQVNAGGKVDYLTWDRSAEALKAEWDIIKDNIFSLTSTPDISFNNVKGIGSVSGVTMEFMFMDAILKSKNKQEIFGEALERRFNILRAICGNVTNTSLKTQFDRLEATHTFVSPMPKDITLLDKLVNATGGMAVMSQETAVNMNPYVSDGGIEYEKMKKEENESVKKDLNDESFNINNQQ